MGGFPEKGKKLQPVSGIFQEFPAKMTKFDVSFCYTGESSHKEKSSNKNVIIFKKAIAICKQVCYNTVTYIRNKGVRAYEEEICMRIAGSRSAG